MPGARPAPRPHRVARSSRERRHSDSEKVQPSPSRRSGPSRRRRAAQGSDGQDYVTPPVTTSGSPRLSRPGAERTITFPLRSNLATVGIDVGAWRTSDDVESSRRSVRSALRLLKRCKHQGFRWTAERGAADRAVASLSPQSDAGGVSVSGCIPRGAATSPARPPWLLQRQTSHQPIARFERLRCERAPIVGPQRTSLHAAVVRLHP